MVLHYRAAFSYFFNMWFVRYDCDIVIVNLLYQYGIIMLVLCYCYVNVVLLM